MILTKKQLLKEIEDFDDDAIVMMERVEDVYFEKENNWEVEKLPCDVADGMFDEYFTATQVTGNKTKNKIYIHGHY